MEAIYESCKEFPRNKISRHSWKFLKQLHKRSGKYRSFGRIIFLELPNCMPNASIRTILLESSEISRCGQHFIQHDFTSLFSQKTVGQLGSSSGMAAALNLRQDFCKFRNNFRLLTIAVFSLAYVIIQVE